MQTTETNRTIDLSRDVEIAAPIEIVFESLLDELGPEGQMPDGTAFPMKIEAWPGGRWYRDLGGNSGHFWGHVQVIKPPTLLEICGPMFMSYPAISHVQYRLKAAEGRGSGGGGGTRLTMTHRAIGLISAEHQEGVVTGWEHGLKRIRELAERRRDASRRG